VLVPVIVLMLGFVHAATLIRQLTETISSRHRHRLRSTTGHLWQARYYSCPLDAEHVWHALAYVEQNPVRARLVPTAEEYRWSSARNVHPGQIDKIAT
jgi:hypothetical protein